MGACTYDHKADPRRLRDHRAPAGQGGITRTIGVSLRQDDWGDGIEKDGCSRQGCISTSRYGNVELGAGEGEKAKLGLDLIERWYSWMGIPLVYMSAGV